MHKFKIGDRVIIARPEGASYLPFKGIVSTVTGFYGNADITIDPDPLYILDAKDFRGHKGRKNPHSLYYWTRELDPADIVVKVN